MLKLIKYNVDYYGGSINNVGYHLFKRQKQPIHIRVSFLAGSRFDKISGTAHFLEHMLLAGSQKYPNKRLLTTSLENIGGSIGAYTNNNFITIFLEFAEKKDLPFALSILDEIVNKPLFEEKAIETERGAIFSEIQTRFYNRNLRVMDIANTLTYQQTPCGKIVIGEESSVKQIKKDDLPDFYEKIFKKNPVSWSVSGDVEEREAIEAITKFFQPSFSFKQIITDKLPVVREKTILLEGFEDNKADLYLSFRTEPADYVEIANLEIISSYLAKGRGSKLQDELRYKRGLVYGCHGNSRSSFDYGEWFLTTSCLAEKTQEVIDIVVSEIEQIKKGGIPKEDLPLVKNKIIKGNIIRLQSARDWAELGSDPAFVAAPEKFLISNYEKDIEEATNESIIKTAKKYFTDDNWFLAICGPKSLNNTQVKIRA